MAIPRHNTMRFNTLATVTTLSVCFASSVDNLIASHSNDCSTTQLDLSEDTPTADPGRDVNTPIDYELCHSPSIIVTHNCNNGDNALISGQAPTLRDGQQANDSHESNVHSPTSNVLSTQARPFDILALSKQLLSKSKSDFLDLMGRPYGDLVLVPFMLLATQALFPYAEQKALYEAITKVASDTRSPLGKFLLRYYSAAMVLHVLFTLPVGGQSEQNKPLSYLIMYFCAWLMHGLMRILRTFQEKNLHIALDALTQAGFNASVAKDHYLTSGKAILFIPTVAAILPLLHRVLRMPLSIPSILKSIRSELEQEKATRPIDADGLTSEFSEKPDLQK